MQFRYANVNWTEILSLFKTAHLVYLVHLEYLVCSFLQRPSSNLLAGGPLHGPTVDVPPSIAVTSTLLRVAGGSSKVACLLAHGEWNCASFTNRHKRQSTQN